MTKSSRKPESLSQTPAIDPRETALARHLAEAQLPGDGDLDADGLIAAARFLLAAGGRRERTQTALSIENVSREGGGRFMRIAIVNEDMPFLVDSIATTISAQGLVIDRLLHPVVPVLRDGRGEITEIPEDHGPGIPRESMVYLETARADARTRSAISAALGVTLGDVRAAVGDWPAIQRAMVDDAATLNAMDRTEGAALLRWFNDGMLTQLGHVVRRRDGTQTGALGICRKSTWELLSAPAYARCFAWFDQFLARGGAGRLPLIVKSNRIAHVHRRVPLDLFILPVIEEGKLAALSVHAGVWTSAALATAPGHVPLMRAQLSALLEKHEFSPNGHAGKVLTHAMTSLPHDLMIGFTDVDMERVALAMMSLIDRPRPRIALVCATLERHLYAFVWLPRDSVATEVRHEIAQMLSEATGGQVIDWSLEVEGSNLAQLRFTLSVDEALETCPEPDEAALDARLRAMLRGWGDAVEAEIARSEEPGRAAAIAGRYAGAFPIAYRNLYGPAEAAQDIGHLRRIAGAPDDDAHQRGVRLYRLPGDEEGQLRLKLYQRHGSLILSDVVPALENFGFRVIDTIPTTLESGDLALGSIHDFVLALRGGQSLSEVLGHAPIIEDALTAMLHGAGENDGFNRLIVGVGLSAREANWLRAFYRYLRQTGLSYGIDTAVDALLGAPMVTLGLVDLLRARHQPGIEDRDKAEAQAEEAIRDGLAGVTAINQDRLLRAFRAVVHACLRTNAFVDAGREALAFKFDSALVPGLPKPLPWREIFVYSPRVEGIHLRAGPVARGGLRWSDRRDDFRTEVLGLMKAQRVKNAVIVPTGAKGGFYPKQLPDPTQNRDAWANEGRESYKLFIRTLLSLTDNIVDGAVVHPAGMVVLDGEDPYFVVAADKGTATFSDTANALAAEKDFWLDDAFASGGSKGYDHKAMGITARGAWISVQRHFREMGVDVQTDPIRVVGVGDMSGDVFGNGMLLSRSTRLVAAFDHRHIFLDPAPDAEKSWEERNRLFALPRSSWDDYDKSLISQGGGVFPRTQKSIPLTPEICEALGLEGESIDPDSLMTAILKAPVDLLWFGGIGTYVKAPHEAHADVGDPANDAIRVNGADVRARVIGEGGNLGCTQAGRIDYGLHGAQGVGGRDNPDFIDNSAGVDCSDKEVNIKIALASAKRAGRLDEDGRVALLSSMTEDVAALVLEDNRLQALGLSIAESGGAAAVPGYVRLIEVLEDGGHLDRRTEGLADADTFHRRAEDGEGFTRPELAVLLSSAKLVLQDALERSGVLDDPGLEEDLLSAFPPAMRETYREDILNHRLRREILATRIANRLVNRMGFIHPFELAEEEGVSLADVAAAFLAAERLFAMGPVWNDIESGQMEEPARILLFERAAHALRGHMADLLRAGAAQEFPSVLADALAPALEELAGALDGLLVSEARSGSARLRAELSVAGANEAELSSVVRLFDLDGAVGIAALAHGAGLEAVSLAKAFTSLGATLGLDWAQATAARLSPSDPWERLLVGGLARDFQQMRLDALRRWNGGDPQGAVNDWLAAQAEGVARFGGMIERARKVVPTTPALLAQIAGQARGLLMR
ncbi:glutamate dehydrogenase [Novosphingobium sp. 1748]|uniref:NAD-glutamate dehydrogenase n=1 Tax=Novosphingobium sp. 1748 TaxID=2817760 RepID=UPI0028648E91|nr:NAD-glutamate dehydrogenase domain-containing protein [Novosphingobium sp. 1748]MDR6705663.1 glutamate dehydrogenase [Novosphingobium sp. 1748]